MKRVLFIDRDGVILIEPEKDKQIDSLMKFGFIPGLIGNLSRIRRSGKYQFVMVSNQDGLGTDSFPEEDFWPCHNLMLETLKGEGIEFDDILIDRSFPEDNAPGRKPRTGMLGKYIEGDFDLENSYVIGDRLTDVELAKNLGTKAIFFSDIENEKELKKAGLSDICALISNDWNTIATFLSGEGRVARVSRKTKETDIQVELNLDGTGKCDISTGLGFLDHMLDQLGRHSSSDLNVKVSGDLNVDEHHTTEDTALAIGEALKNALGNKMGIKRYGFVLPMDECLAQVSIDLSGRPSLVWDAEFKREKIGDMPTEMLMHFFKSLTDASGMTLHIKAEGDNEHHKAEAIFKAVAKTIGQAKSIGTDTGLPSTKGKL